VDWADELAASVEGPQVVNDSKTPSGTVHVGSLRGPVILDVITRALRARDLPTTLLYGVDDLDPMDAQALLSPDAIEREMGRPLAHVPDPHGDCHASYARHFAGIFIDTFAGLGIHPDRYYWMSDIYPTGSMDPFIKIALEKAEIVREVYLRVSKVERPAGWLPVQAVCPNCGKVGTTIALDWDGTTIRVECRPDYVTWAQGCGYVGRLSPFGGTAKLYWNLEWAAQWSLFGVTIEPCGKDLSTAGGSRERADAIAREVFDREPPLNFPYEFLNIGGKKMSTSKGRGAAAHTITTVVPPEQLRFLFVRSRPESVIEFDPEGTDAIPRLFDEFDRLADATAGKEVRGELPSGHENIFRFSLLDAGADVMAAADAYRPPYGHLALLAQVPGVDVLARVEAEKGAALTETERAEFDARLASAVRWLEAYAPERARIEIRRNAIPAEAELLRPEQRGFLRALGETAAHGNAPATGEQWQAAIFAVAAHHGIDAKAAFNALYLAFLGRANGPRAGWLLASLDRDFVIARLGEAGSAAGEATE